MSEEPEDETWWTGSHKPKEPTDGAESIPTDREPNALDQSPMLFGPDAFEDSRVAETLILDKLRQLVKQLEDDADYQHPLEAMTFAPEQISNDRALHYWSERLNYPEEGIAFLTPQTLAYLLQQHRIDPYFDWPHHIRQLEAGQRSWVNRLRRIFTQNTDASEELVLARLAQKAHALSLRQIIVSVDHLTLLPRTTDVVKNFQRRLLHVPLLAFAGELDYTLPVTAQLQLPGDRIQSLADSSLRNRLLQLCTVLRRLEGSDDSYKIFDTKIHDRSHQEPVPRNLYSQPHLQVVEAFYRVVLRDGVEVLRDA